MHNAKESFLYLNGTLVASCNKEIGFLVLNTRQVYNNSLSLTISFIVLQLTKSSPVFVFHMAYKNALYWYGRNYSAIGGHIRHRKFSVFVFISRRDVKKSLQNSPTRDFKFTSLHWLKLIYFLCQRNFSAISVNDLYT